MSRFRKLSHAIWYCQYHFVWVPKCRYRIVNGAKSARSWQSLRHLSALKLTLQNAASARPSAGRKIGHHAATSGLQELHDTV